MRTSLVALALLIAGCTPELCSRTSDCLRGQICTAAGQCAVPADASTVDTGGSNDTGDDIIFEEVPRSIALPQEQASTHSEREIRHGR